MYRTILGAYACNHHTHCNFLVHDSIVHVEARRRATDAVFSGAIFPSLLSLLSPFSDTVFSGTVSLQSSLSLSWYCPRRFHFSHHFLTRSPLFLHISVRYVLSMFSRLISPQFIYYVFWNLISFLFLIFDIKIDVVLCFWMYVMTFSIFHLCLLTLAFSRLLSHLVLKLSFCTPKLNRKFKG